MRLIDADELKKSLEDTVCIEPMPYAFVKQIIDNAPTIKIFTLADIEDQYRKGLEKGLSEWETERPQGEWLEKLDYNRDTYYDCSVCGNSWTTIEGTPWNNGMNFCPNCGARLRGEKNETD